MAHLYEDTSQYICLKTVLYFTCTYS